MQSLLDFIRSIGSMIGKNEVSKSCELQLRNLEKVTVPAYRHAVETFASFELKNKDNQELQKLLRKDCRNNRETMFVLIYDALMNAEKLLRDIEKKADVLFAEKEMTSAMSFRKATYLRLVASIGFFEDYSRRILNEVLVRESYGETNPERAGGLNQAEIDFLETYRLAYCSITALLYLNESKGFSAIDDMPEAVVTEMSQQVMVHTAGGHKIDPLGMNNFILPDASVRHNPFYLVGTLIAHYQAAQYRTAEQELALLQLRLINLENKKKGGSGANAALDKQIEVCQSRVNGLRFDLAEMDKSYGLV